MLGIKDAIKQATEATYNKVLQYCYENGISNHTSEVKWSYDEQKNVGRVWTNDWVLIFNEMGTGITGKGKSHPYSSGPFKSWKYDINSHGEAGWWYPTTESDPNPYKWTDKDGQLRAWTQGLPSRHMFYSAYNDIKNEIGNYVEVGLRKTTKKMY